MRRESNRKYRYYCRHRQATALAFISLLSFQCAATEMATGTSARHRSLYARQKRPGESIPKLLHYIYLTGLQAYTADSSQPNSRIPKKYFDGCQKLHEHWDSLFWDEAMGLQLIKENYSWFLPVWESFSGWGKQVILARTDIHTPRNSFRLRLYFNISAIS